MVEKINVYAKIGEKFDAFRGEEILLLNIKSGNIGNFRIIGLEVSIRAGSDDESEKGTVIYRSDRLKPSIDKAPISDDDAYSLALTIANIEAAVLTGYEISFGCCVRGVNDFNKLGRQLDMYLGQNPS